MNQRIQAKLAQYKKLATGQNGNISTHSIGNRADSLRQVIRSKKDADEFMAELEWVAKRSK